MLARAWALAEIAASFHAEVAISGDIETKAGIDISLSPFAAKSQCCAVLLTLSFSSVKLPSIGMLSCCSLIMSCQGVNVPQERIIISISDS